MIESLSMKRFRGIQEGSLEGFTQVNVLVGKNGMGKSAVLDALFIGASRNVGRAIGDAAARHLNVPNVGRWLFWRDDEDAVILTNEALNRRETRLRLIEGGTSQETTVVAEITSEVLELSKKDVAQVHWKNIAGGKKQAAYGGSPLLGDVAAVKLVQAWDQEKPLHDLYSDVVRAGLLDEVMTLACVVVPGLQKMDVLTDDARPSLYLTLEGKNVIPATMAGDGVKALLRLSMELGSQSGGIVLLEEPEVHQHPGALWVIAKAISAAAAQGVQVFLSTHSLELVDAIAEETKERDVGLSVYRQLLRDGILSTSCFGRDDIETVRETLGEDLR